ncbi:sodium channel modifier 1-like isoform X1 [Chamaea fasciata]|uniref:sodium channel modifier 1-like isoform X1 n=1 Tax=Chamaea fasciata TaxID=190680 RepID=UPI00336A73A4
MSFKRDENDPGPLGALQRRRVAELLASAIPEDEALLLRDGRLACSLCPQRPVCDTLQTLLLHRAGRKHLDSLQRSYGRHRRLQVGPQVTPQEEQGAASGVQAPLLARTRRVARSALLSSAPYSSRCRRHPTKGSSSRAGISGITPKNSQEPSQNSGNSGIPPHTEASPCPPQVFPRKRSREGKEIPGFLKGIPDFPKGIRARSGCGCCGITCTCAAGVGSRIRPGIGSRTKTSSSTPTRRSRRRCHRPDDGPKMSPNVPKMSPKHPQNVPKCPQNVPKCPQMSPEQQE